MKRRTLLVIAGLLGATIHEVTPVVAEDAPADPVFALMEGYPHFIERNDGNDLVFKDGTRMPISDGKGAKPFEDMLDDPDIKDMFFLRYPAGDTASIPSVDFDPGRIRYLPLFKKMYGDCQAHGFMANAMDVRWLPSKYGKSIQFTKINSAAAALQAVSDELDKLPDRFLDYLRPTQGTYNCRPVAGTTRQSPHGFGIAIDLASAYSDYWLESKIDVNGRVIYKNRIPQEIVDIFEKHGFIWGGRWYHYDTMHFEYRPEIIAAAKRGR